MATRLLEQIALIAGFLLGASATPQAQALEVGRCAPTAEISAALKAERQKSLITGGRVVAAGYMPAVIFTSNAKGNGYLVEGDKALGQTSNNMCVMVKFSNLKLYDARKEGTPADVLTGTKIDDNIHHAEKRGSRVMLQGEVIQEGKPVALVTIFGNMKNGVGGMFYVQGRNSVISKAAFGGIIYTNTAITILDEGSTTN